MPDLKQKSSDSELNPSQKDFEEIVSRPDMRALDDRGDAIARDLKNAESSLDTPNDFRENDGKDAARRAEAQQWNAPENKFYRPSEKVQARIDGWSKRRKASVFGGVGGGAIGIIVLLMSLLPLKVPGIMSMVTDHAMQRVEQVTEKRAKIIIGRAILTKFGTHTGIVITGEGAFKTLVASMRTSRFEEKLAAKGLVITATSGGVTLKQNGVPIGGGREFKNEKAIMDALDANKLTKKMVDDIVKEEIPTWRWIKRAKFAKWLRIKYGIPRYGLTNSNQSDPEEREKEMDTERAERATSRTTGNFRELLTCIMGGACQATGDDDGIASKKEEQASDTTEDVDKTAQESIEEIRQNGLGDRSGATKTLSKMLVEKLGTKAIPIIGWIDLVATLDHFAHEAGDKDYIGKVSAYYKGAAYAAVYADWSGYGSQVQLGAMDPEYVGKLASELDGAETAQAYQAIAGNDTSKGVPIETLVNSDKPSNSKQLYDTILNGPVGFGNKYVGHPILNAYYETVGAGGFLGWLGSNIGGILGSIASFGMDIISGLTPDAAENKIKELARETVAELAPHILKAFGLTIDALDTGAGLMNNLIGGGTVSANDYCKEQLSCRKLSTAQAYTQNAIIASERAEELKEKGVMYALFDKEDSRSAVNQLAINMPTSVESGLSSVASLLTSTPSRLLGFIAPQSKAAGNQTTEQLFGVAPYGATTADLNRPLSKEAQEGTACPEVAEGDFNDCTADTEIIEGMLCEYQSESEDCSDEESTAALSGDGSEFTVGSYNILHSENHAKKSRSLVGCNNNPVVGDPNCARKRAELQAKIIRGNVGNIPAFDIFGTQETSPEQYNIFKEILTEYDVFPDNPSRMSNQKDGAVAIFWNKAKFTKFDSGKFASLSNVIKPAEGLDGNITNPWVGLQSASGHKVYVTSVHLATGGYGGTPDNMRKVADMISTWVKSVVKPDSTVIVVGDMNDKLSEKLTYCVFTRNGLMQHARDMRDSVSVTKECPNPVNKQASIDHIYATPSPSELTVKKWADPTMGLDPILSRASDHTPVYAVYSLPGIGGSAGVAGDWTWPLDAKWWKSIRDDFLGAHTATSGTWTSGVDRLAADISIPPDGSPVYAMVGGKVTRPDLGGHGLIISSEIQGGTLQIAYGHGPRTNRNTTYKTGDKIMSVGALGDNVTGGHLHIDMSFTKNGVKKGVCAQDVFLALGAGKEPDLEALTKKATPPCGR